MGKMKALYTEQQMLAEEIVEYACGQNHTSISQFVEAVNKEADKRELDSQMYNYLDELIAKVIYND
jgi:GTP-binding protein EngB required for normal cell division